ncbi:hypothetical protein [Enterococcus sp. LJL51]|uniref:hypothetical protein n=1 Tax=Enterococcus sp. LJL51 TaxID=3416656 RepID=UPI003CF93CB2
MENMNYERITDNVFFSFEEYMDEAGWTVAQTTSKTIDNFTGFINLSPFITYSYFVRLGIESLNRGQIADYLLEKLSNIDEVISNLENPELDLLKADVLVYKQLLEKKEYEIVETSLDTKYRVDYILSIKPEDWFNT